MAETQARDSKCAQACGNCAGHARRPDATPESGALHTCQLQHLTRSALSTATVLEAQKIEVHSWLGVLGGRVHVAQTASRV